MPEREEKGEDKGAREGETEGRTKRGRKVFSGEGGKW